MLIVAGLAIAAGAFLRPVRWLILPAVLMALSTGSVAAADISLDGGVGERHYRPASMADLHDRYELGMGELDIDLRDLELPPGTPRSRSTWASATCSSRCPTDVCVASRADIGVGEANVLGRTNGGVDVSFEEHPEAPPSTSRLVLDAEIGVGAIEVRDADDLPLRRFDGLRPRFRRLRPRHRRQQRVPGARRMGDRRPDLAVARGRPRGGSLRHRCCSWTTRARST